MKTRYLWIVFLLHENARIQFVFLNVILQFTPARERCTFQAISHRITNGECREKMISVDCFPAPRKLYLVFLNVFLQFSRTHERCIFQSSSRRITDGEGHKNMMFVDCFSAPRKPQCLACFPERFSIVFPCARTLHFPSVFHMKLQMVKAMKT